MTTARVFPRKTNASPRDSLSFFGEPNLFSKESEISKVRVSVTFSADLKKAEALAASWEKIAPVEIGGPAIGDPGGEFTPGMYLRNGYTITSRGCPNNCWFCDVPGREGPIRELQIKPGWNLLDSNLLACSEGHIREVFNMLGEQSRRAEFTGGLEAARLQPWHVGLLWNLRPSQMFFAYDTPNDKEPLFEAGKMLRHADFTRRHMRCYVLIGGPKDTISAAEQRLLTAWSFGFMPMAMLWLDKNNTKPKREWYQFQRNWARPALIKGMMRSAYKDSP